MTAGWKPLDPEIAEFVAEFERRGADPATDSGDQFGDQFIAADPTRAVTVARDVLVATLPHRRKMFADAGVGHARCVDARQLDLDPLHVIVRTEWDAARAGGRPLRLESSFLLRRTDEGPRILVYLNHRDVAAALAEA